MIVSLMVVAPNLKNFRDEPRFESALDLNDDVE